MMTPAHDKIVAQFPKSRWNKAPFKKGDRFEAALNTLAQGEAAGKIWNVEFQDAKYYIAQACEHAEKVSSHDAHEFNPEGGVKHFPGNDPRNQIGWAFGMNQAAKASRTLKKLPADLVTPGIAEYIAVLDQIAELFKYLQSFKTIIQKGRRPVEKNEEQLRDAVENTGICPICSRRQKLDRVGAVGSRKLVHHGYQMSDYNHAGYRIGQCFGTNYLPYEISCEANKDFKVFLETELVNYKEALTDYQASKHETLDVEEYVKGGGLRQKQTVAYVRGTAQYESERETRIYRLEQQIRWTEDDIKTQTAKINGWKPQPLIDQK